MSIVASGSAAIARAAGRASRAMGRGGGTSVPGVVLLRINPRAVDTLAARLGGGSILVSATNGKTTTTRMLGGALRADGAEVITNGAGANLLSGIASTLADARLGRPETARGLFECDEAALPEGWTTQRWQPALSRMQPTPRDAGRAMPRSPTTTSGSAISAIGAVEGAEARARTSMWPSSTPGCGAPRGRIHASVHPMAR